MARLLAALLLGAFPANAAVHVWVAGESEKVRPDAPAPPVRRTTIELSAAGGECTGAQIIVRGAEPIAGLTAAARALRGANSAAVPLELSRVATILLERPTQTEGTAGEWPDALIPARDALWNEKRRAFPIDVPSGRSQAIFIEACASRGAPGRYRGAVQLQWKTAKGRARISIPVELRVRAFDIPATPALITAFGFSGYSAAKAHGRPPADEDRRELTRLYDTMALRRGITLFGGTQDPPPWSDTGDGLRIDWTAYDAEVAPFLDGTALPSHARWTAVELREWPRHTREQRKAWRRAWVEHFRARGWLDRLFAYVQDEPPPSEFARVEERARELREDAPEIRRLVTAPYSDKLRSINLWVSVLNCLDVTSPSCPRPVPRARYESLWWYQSCLSHGCGPVPPGYHDVFVGWPSYMIDAPATAARAMGWLAFANGISGELYFDVVYAYHEGHPWESQWAFEGNGDGTLYYPGTPGRVGGEHDVPIESLRIVQIQRSLQDHAYLTLCAQLGDAAFANAEARAIAPSLRGWARDPAAYAAARERLAKRIEQLYAKYPAGALGLGRTE
jgi:hypothetical protein